jgi:hypothetical protein
VKLLAYLKTSLEKFPVTTDRREYLVTVDHEDCVGLVARVYMKNWKKIHLFKYIKVYSLRSTYDNTKEFYEKYESDYIRLVKDAVKEYEHWEENDFAKEEAIKNAVSEFDKWNGEVK